MDHYFDLSQRHRITAANRNQYLTPMLHPNRRMAEHDLIYMLEGTWKIGQEGEAYEIQKDDVLILEAGRAHYGIEPCAPGTQTIFIHALALDTDALLPGQPHAPLILTSQIHAKGNPSVRRCFEQVAYAKGCHDDPMAAAYFDVLLYELRKCLHIAPSNTLAEDIRQMVLSSNHLMTNGEIASRLHISVKTAEQTFRKCFHQTIHRYQIEAKVENAKFYLTNFPEMRLAEIAANLGFYDEFHFSKQFRQVAGMPPGKYRRQAGSGSGSAH